MKSSPRRDVMGKGGREDRSNQLCKTYQSYKQTRCPRGWGYEAGLGSWRGERGVSLCLLGTICSCSESPKANDLRAELSLNQEASNSAHPQWKLVLSTHDLHRVEVLKFFCIFCMIKCGS